MSINFPFDTAEEFLNATRKVRKKRMPATVNLESPAMPDVTPTAKAAVLMAAGGVVAFVKSDDWRIQIATIAGSVVVILGLLAHDAYIRGKRNDRISAENTQSLDAATAIRIQEIHSEEE